MVENLSKKGFLGKNKTSERSEPTVILPPQKRDPGPGKIISLNNVIEKKGVCIHRAPSWMWWMAYIVKLTTPLAFCVTVLAIIALLVLSFIMM